MIELCAVVFEPDIDCPIKFPFDVQLYTADGSAGKFWCACLKKEGTISSFSHFPQLKQWIMEHLMRY